MPGIRQVVQICESCNASSLVMFLFVNLPRQTVDKVDTQGAMVYTKVSTPSATARPTRIVVYIVNILQTLAYLQLPSVGWEDLYSQKGRSYIFK